jgi:hypothetical protein
VNWTELVSFCDDGNEPPGSITEISDHLNNCLIIQGRSCAMGIAGCFDS